MTNEEARVTLRVDTDSARKKFDSLEKRATELRGKLADAFRVGDPKGIREINKELQATERQMTAMRTNAANIRAAMERLDESTPKQLRKTIADINRELSSGRVQRGSREWDMYTQAVRKAKAQLQELQAEQRNTEGMLSRLNRKFNDWGAGLAASMAAFAGVVMGGREAVQAYADMEAEEANVIKYTEMTKEAVAELNEEFKQMDTRTSREELNRLAQEAGRLGKTDKEDVLGYVRAADKINVALDELGEGATLTLSKLTGIFGIEAEYGTEEALLRTGSVVNDLSQNCSAAAPYLVEFASRLGGVAAQSHMAVDQVLSFAAVLDTQNLNVEASATVMTQLITDMYKEPAKVAKAAGMDVKEFANLVKTDMNGALIALFEQLNKQGGMESLAKIFTDMGTDGARAQPVLSALAGHVEELKNQQLAANEAFKDGTSIGREFEVQNNTVQAQLDKAKNKFHEVAVELGEKLLPVMKYAVSGSSMLLRVMSGLVDFFLKYKTEIIAVAGAVAVYELASAAAVIKTKLLTAASYAASVAVKAYNTALSIGRVAVATFTNAIDYLRNGFKTTAEMQQRWSKAIAGMSFANALTAVAALSAAVFVLYRRLEDIFSVTKMLKDIEHQVNETVAESVGKVNSLKNVLHDSNVEYSARLKALEDLKSIVPDYHADLTKEGQLINDNTKALDDYITKLREEARIKAAQNKITELTKENMDIDDDMEEWMSDAMGESSDFFARLFARNPATALPYQVYRAGKHSYDITTKEANEKKIRVLEKLAYGGEGGGQNAIISNWATNALGGIFSPFAKLFDKANGSNGDNGGNGGGGGSGGNGASSAAEARRKAENRAKEILAAQEEAIKDAADFEQTVNTMSWSAGFKNYEEFVNRRSEIDREAVDKRMALLEKAGLTETDAYKSLAKQREKLVAEGEKKATAASLHEIERRRKEAEQDAVKDFNNPDSDAYQDKALLNTRLLDIDKEYLTSRRDLYEQGSEEWVAANDELLDRLAKDQADKQKQLSDNYLRIRRDYLESDADREKMELAVLEQVHAAGLLSEEEYQKAIQAIKDKYRDKNKEDASKVSSEYFDLIHNLYKAFKTLFADGTKDSKKFWDNMANAAQSAYAVMSAVLSSFSAYSDASRDLELAKVEKRYDREIQAAGNNEKKKEELEKRKEAETAKIKKKYNDRSMKMQMAQALAQTAMAAISAYASALAIGPAGLVLAPIAAAMAVAAGMMQVATIKKQHDAQAQGYYSGGFTRRDPDDRKEVGVVHANEFVANSRAVANPALSPVFRLIDHAQRTNTISSLTAEDVSESLSHGVRVSARGSHARQSSAMNAYAANTSRMEAVTAQAVATMSEVRDRLDGGIEAYVILDGEQGLYKKYNRYQKLIDKPSR